MGRMGLAAAGRRARTAMLATALGLGALAGPVGAQDESAVEQRVMAFDIRYGDDPLNFGQVVEAIRAAHPDITGLQEIDGNPRAVHGGLATALAEAGRSRETRPPYPPAAGAR